MRTTTTPSSNFTSATSATEPTTGRTLLEMFSTGALPPPPAASLLGLDLEVVDDGVTVFGFDARPEYGNPATVHGGVLAAIADFAAATAVWTLLPAESDIVTTDLHVSFVQKVELDNSRYSCRGRVLHLGRTQANAIAEITGPDQQPKVIALATLRIRNSTPTLRGEELFLDGPEGDE